MNSFTNIFLNRILARFNHIQNLDIEDGDDMYCAIRFDIVNKGRFRAVTFDNVFYRVESVGNGVLSKDEAAKKVENVLQRK